MRRGLYYCLSVFVYIKKLRVKDQMPKVSMFDKMYIDICKITD